MTDKTTNATPCRWKRCKARATKLLVGVPLCTEHLGEALALQRDRSWAKCLRLLSGKVTGDSARDLELEAEKYETAERAVPDVVKAREVPGGAAS